MSERTIDVFFYGLFMDVEVLEEAGVAPKNARRAYADGFELRIGQRATLVPSANGRVYGMIFAFTHADLDRLYAKPGLEHYRAEAILVQTFDGQSTPALCFNLIEVPQPLEQNEEYANRLRTVLTKLSFPEDYISTLGV
jgi:hypothetical protein